MGFYDLTKEERTQLVADIQYETQLDLASGSQTSILKYFSDEDTYIRKAAYLGAGRIYNSKVSLRERLLQLLKVLGDHENELVRQTVVNAAGEIGMFRFDKVAYFFDAALFDKHHKVRNAVIGSVKKMSQKNPKPILNWAQQYINHEDAEVRREICHGIELRGRTHPEDILPLLKQLEHDKSKRVLDTLVHVIGQISYKQGCLPKVILALKHWENKEVVQRAIDEIVDVHSAARYSNFTALSQEEVISYLSEQSL